MRSKKRDNKTRRLKLEMEIREGLTKACFALHEIWGEKLFEPEFRSFPEYAGAVWGYCESYAYRQVHYAQFLRDSPNGELAQHLTEGAYRPIDRLNPDERKQATEKLKERIEAGVAISEKVTEEIAREIRPPVANRPVFVLDVDLFCEHADQFTAGAAKLIERIRTASASSDAAIGLGAVSELAAAVGGLLKEIFGTADEKKAKRLLVQYLENLGPTREELPPGVPGKVNLPEPEPAAAPPAINAGNAGPAVADPEVPNMADQNPPAEIVPARVPVSPLGTSPSLEERMTGDGGEVSDAPIKTGTGSSAETAPQAGEPTAAPCVREEGKDGCGVAHPKAQITITVETVPAPAAVEPPPVPNASEEGKGGESALNLDVRCTAVPRPSSEVATKPDIQYAEVPCAKSEYRSWGRR